MKALLCLVLLWAGASSACDCPMPDLKTASQNAAAIFVGTAIGPAAPAKGSIGNYSTVAFEVQKSWKGVTSHKTLVKIGSTMCSLNFEAGKKYLVFSSDQGPIYVHNCSRTALADSAIKDIQALGKELPLK